MSFAITAMVPETIYPGIRHLDLTQTAGGDFILRLVKDPGASAQLEDLVLGVTAAAEASPCHLDDEDHPNSPLVQSVVASPLETPLAAPEEKPRERTSSDQLPLFSRPRRPRAAGGKKVGTKLTLPQVRALKRELRDSGLDDSALGEKYGLHRTHISRIRRGVTYKRIRAERPAAAGVPS